jgi:hypothetical protein
MAAFVAGATEAESGFLDMKNENKEAAKIIGNSGIKSTTQNRQKKFRTKMFSNHHKV